MIVLTLKVTALSACLKTIHPLVSNKMGVRDDVEDSIPFSVLFSAVGVTTNQDGFDCSLLAIRYGLVGSF